jgi:predicted GIY-YIG superfamily endonuclease
MAKLVLNGDTSGSVTLDAPAVSVYWIHNPEHTDMFTQGYIGITKNIKKRWSDHAKRTANNHLLHAIKKYGWDSLVKEVVLVADEAYCLMVEAKLRAEDKIGWNIIKGGGKPPVRFNNKDRLGKSAWNKGTKGLMTAWNKGIKYTEEQKVNIFKLSEYMKDKPHGMLGKTQSIEAIESIRQKKSGKKQTLETIEKRRKTMIGYVYKKTTCPKCNKSISINMVKRFHFDNCKGINPVKARTTVNGKRIFIGTFATKELANVAIENYKKENS